MLSFAQECIYLGAVTGFNTQNALLLSTESVPFRFTPNLQQLVGPIGTEALLCPGIVAIARALTKPEVSDSV